MNIELLRFQADYASEIVEQALSQTLWSPRLETNEKLMYQLAGLKRPPFGSQVENGILPIYTALQKYGYGILNADMGTGKTQMSFSSAYLYLMNEHSDNRRLLFLTAGGKHIPKMIREAKAIYGEECEVYTIVNKFPHEKRKKGEVIPEEVVSMEAPEGKIQVFILSKDTAKMDLRTEVVYNWGDRCPSCYGKILPKNWTIKVKKFPKGWQKEASKYFAKIKGQPYNCPKCDCSLESQVAKNIWEGKGVFKSKSPKFLKGSRKISIGRKFRRLMSKSKGRKNIFGMIIVDEVHEMQSGSSLQGRVYRDLVKVSKTAMIMTGTLSNGYPSSVFYILQAIMPKYFKDLGYSFHDVGKFIDHYGARKFTRSRDVVEKRGNRVVVKVNELPKISDRIVSLMAPFTAWLKMEDLNLKMPPYSEEAIIIDMNEDIQKRLGDFKSKALSLLKKHNPKLIKSFAQRFMYLQNNVTFPFEYEFEGEVVSKNPETNVTKIEKKMFKTTFEPFPEDRLFSKELKLVQLVDADLKKGRKCLVYSIYNKAAKIADRLETVLNRELKGDITIKVLPENIGGIKIEPWIEANPCDVLIASPLKLSTGLDLPQFPSIYFYETGTKLRTVQQAARRSWRAVGQDKPVKIYFSAYQGIQASILDIMAKKMRAAAVIEGKKVTEGQLASVFDDDADFTRALNNIANELEQDFKPDFSSSSIEEGKLRPATVLEIRFEEILKEVKGSGEDEDYSEDSFEETKEEIVESTVIPIEEEIVAAKAFKEVESTVIPIEEEIVKEKAFEDIESEEEIKVTTIVSPTGSKQMAFLF